MAHQAEMILGFASAADDYLQFRRLALCGQSTPETASHEKAEGPSALARPPRGAERPQYEPGARGRDPVSPSLPAPGGRRAASPAARETRAGR